MKILYGVQGTGNGHISRARAMAKAMAAQGLDVQFLFSGRPTKDYFDMADFGDYWLRDGLSFVSSQGRIRPLKTAFKLKLWRCYRDIQQLDCSPYDLVISDFEPITAWAGKKQGKPVLSLSHQAALLADVPGQVEQVLPRWLMTHFAPASEYLGLHWYHFGQALLPPIVDLSPQQLSQASISTDAPVLVYLPFESLAEIQSLFSRFHHQNFVIFHPAIDGPRVVANLQLCPPSRSGFAEALMAASGVIANAGFELPSEALSLGKKLLLKPLQGQFEQQFNGTSLMAMGLAQLMPRFDLTTIANWLQKDAVGRVCYPNVAQAIATWFAQGMQQPLTEIATQLWQQTHFPDSVLALLEPDADGAAMAFQSLS
ncbi:hypothetical protein VST7929_00273 [Vibrio stylophorae]|uniref:Glycosyltransferase n=1 Tax=Vibrio stylophorae TaxID=659351 RepID=A0ABM8ZQ67_9VIBR|nr:MJ1255/VC2487 family glycosyltransferase [Vibrio stylophorae]CAH0532444.1 hypothetical protein VST7929_00273 [Vibrio stylophorae]